jgi:hypothetical protein
MESFSILHLSDFHISAKPNVRNVVDAFRNKDWTAARFALTSLTSYNPLLLEGVARFIYRDVPPVDLIVITGDLATTGSVSDLTRAFEFVDTPSTSLWSSSAGPTLRNSRDENRVRLLPGNHDRYHSGPFYFPGNKRFDVVFGKYWQAYQGAQLQAVLGRGDDRLAVISADFSLQAAADAVGSPTAYLGQGKVYSGTLNSLENLTLALRQQYAPIAIVWAIHFPPEYPNIDPQLRLLDGLDVVALAQRLDVRHLLAGHTHSALLYNCVPYNVNVICAGTASNCSDPTGHSIHLCQFSIEGSMVIDTSTLTWKWDSEHGDFR